MGLAEQFDRDSTLFVARGLYLLSYETGPEGIEAPTAFVAPAQGFENAIDIMGAPGAPDGRLEGPGAVLFLRATDNASLRVGVRRKSAAGSLEAALKLESVGGLSQSPERVAKLAATRAEDSGAFLFVAHVARRGDIAVRPGEWAAGPDAPAKIEGLEMCEPGFEGVGLEMQVLVDGAWSPWVRAGAFLGSRGRNLPLLGVRLRLTGASSRRYMFNADALFLGSAIANDKGQEIEFLSPAGRDPLVGFRLEIIPERRVSALQTTRPAPIDVERRRVRVFKAAAGEQR